MSRNLPPLRPRRPTDGTISEPLRSPFRTPPPCDLRNATATVTSPTRYASELCTPLPVIKEEATEKSSMFVQQPENPHNPAFQQRPRPVREANMNHGVNNATIWPSEIHSQSSTMWLLPPHSDQSSAITSLLRTEIQSHSITREMLHATEKRRLEAVQRGNKLLQDTHGWAAAYNNLTMALGKCYEEYSRVLGENTEMKLKLEQSRESQAHVDAMDENQIQNFGHDSIAQEATQSLEEELYGIDMYASGEEFEMSDAMNAHELEESDPYSPEV
ncbi:hypothetical protein GGP41_009363 [Bipolaris sorokiniana]|uniref:Uncharacterized protein n=1 Tax=Cochliobolus sativus TaxID=45130 RepID=A0A8H5ZC88_COCSA|nr:hypothetical protein GGP41_009363 [Bipolaris sorokiniana]